MSSKTLLNCRRPPSRLNAKGEAVLFGCRPGDIPILTRCGLIKPPGSPAANAVKVFSPVESEKKLADEKWRRESRNASIATGKRERGEQ